MPRHNLAKYDPRTDSSAGTDEYRQDGDGVILMQRPGDCPCGCLTKPLSKGRTFAMGHDARFRGILIRAHCTGNEVTVIDPDSKEREVFKAMALAETHDWAEYLATAKTREDEKAQRRLDRANKEVLNKALQPGDKKLIKVGRWEHTGQVVAIYEDSGMVEFEYVTKSGDVRRYETVKAEAEKLPAAS